MHRGSSKPSYSWRSRVWLALCVCASLTLVGCTHTASTGHAFVNDSPEADGNAVAVPGSVGWVDAGIQVHAGEPLSITATGRVVVRQSDRWGQTFEATVSPEGTFLVHDGIQDQRFPLPSGNHGPAPCFCLMGRIGENGQPFFVGKSKSWQASESGRLQLAINDFDPSDSEGAFHAQVSRPTVVQPMSYEEIVPTNSEEGTPVDQSRPSLRRIS